MRRVEDVDARLWTAVSEAFERPDHLERALALRQGAQAHDGVDWRNDLDVAERALARLARAEEALLERFGRGLVTESGLDRELERMAKERQLQAHQAESARRALGGVQRSKLQTEGVLVTLATLRERLHGATPEQRRDLLRSLIPRREEGAVALGRDSIEVTLRVAPEPAALAHAAGSSTEREDNGLVLRIVA